MEKYYQEIASLLPFDEHLEISYNKDADVIAITTDDVMIHGDTAAKIYSYCAQNTLRCYIAWNYVTRQLYLGILNDNY